MPGSVLFLSHVVFQSPDFITTSVGESFRLKCTRDLPMSYCYNSISWHKVNLRSGKLGEVSVHNKDQLEDDKKSCTKTISNAQVKDSGIYYCASVHDKMLFIGTLGNQSRRHRVDDDTKSYDTKKSPTLYTTHITKNTGPLNLSVVLYTPEVEEDDASVLLQCVVMDAVPSQVRVWWLVDDEERTGWIESGWTEHDDSATEYTRAQIRVSAEEWDEVTIQCVVNYKNQTVSRAVPPPSKQTLMCRSVSCTWLLYGGCSVAVFTIAVAITVVLCLRKGE
ncbi:hypothetical protein QTP86_029838 [Hemibagrus guttatus]|nr:hypothetical protein QTP86_029838 [Hemibagrus guttatus]